MRSKRMAIGASVILLLAGCANPEAVAYRNNIISTARSASLPKDFREQIDRHFAATLIDPDSRRINISKTPGGSLVCGYINAKNRMGGYTGPQFFLAYFSHSGYPKVYNLDAPASSAAQQFSNVTEATAIFELRKDCD